MKMLQQIFLIAALIMTAPIAHAEDSGGLKSLRGNLDISQEPAKPVIKRWKSDSEPVERAFVHQPPVIPHKIVGYQLNMKANKCLTCHSWANYKASGATKISISHFTDRDGHDLSNMSARRYFCTQCHVPQVDAKPLVENTYQPMRSIKSR